MSQFPYRQDREELKMVLQQYENLKAGLTNSFIELDGFERIVEHFEDQEQFLQALQALQYGLSQYPHAVSLLFLQANALVVLRRYSEALEVLDLAENLDSTETTLYILKTDALLALDRQEEAAELLETAINHFEGDEKIDLLFELADVYDDYENFEKVFDCYSEILKLEPNNEEALYKICFWTDFTGRNEESIRLHQNILEEYPYNELAWFNLGAAYQGLKLHEKAIDAYKFAVAINEKFDYAYRNMGDACIRLRQYKDAIENLEKVLELARPESVIYEAIGHCYDKLSNFSQARFHFKKASHLSSEDSHLYYKIATTYMNEGSWQSAIKQLLVATRIHKMQPDYNLALGQCYLHLNNLEEAISFFGNVVRVRPKNANGWMELLKCLLIGGMIEEGIDYADFAYEQTDQKPIFIFFKSMFLFANGNAKEALLQLEKGMVINPKLVKKFIELNPAILQNPQVVEVIARFKKQKNIR